MCIICVSNKGIKQPTKDQLLQMFLNNPHGAGFMFARNGAVTIHKGFMKFAEFYAAVKAENFTKNDVVIYHFRISTQAGVTPEMTHPFPLTANIAECKALDTVCNIGVAHNGIITLTTNHADKEYNDTAHFIAEYMSRIITTESDLKDQNKLRRVEMLAKSKLAILSGSGTVATLGYFIKDKDGLLFSNYTYQPPIYDSYYDLFTYRYGKKH